MLSQPFISIKKQHLFHAKDEQFSTHTNTYNLSRSYKWLWNRLVKRTKAKSRHNATYFVWHFHQNHFATTLHRFNFEIQCRSFCHHFSGFFRCCFILSSLCALSRSIFGAKSMLLFNTFDFSTSFHLICICHCVLKIVLIMQLSKTHI